MHLAQAAGSFEHGNEPSDSEWRGISWLAKWLSASQEGLWSMGLVPYWLSNQPTEGFHKTVIYVMSSEDSFTFVHLNSLPW